MPARPPLPAASPPRRYGWRPDVPDLRDERYCVPRAAADLPRALRGLPSRWPGVDDQLDLGSCTAFGTEFVWRAALLAQGVEAPAGSRLFIYWNERDREGTVREDAGAQIRTGMKVLSKLGVPPEPLWPYRVARFAARPPTKAFAAASARQVLRYARVPQTLRCLKGALSAGRPVVFGFTVYESFEETAGGSGAMAVPGPKERALGGHCAVAVGWDDDVRCPRAGAPGALLVRNSYGPRWGIRPTADEPHLAGHFWLPYQIATDANASDDYWGVFQVEDDAAGG